MGDCHVLADGAFSLLLPGVRAHACRRKHRTELLQVEKIGVLGGFHVCVSSVDTVILAGTRLPARGPGSPGQVCHRGGQAGGHVGRSWGVPRWARAWDSTQ